MLEFASCNQCPSAAACALISSHILSPVHGYTLAVCASRADSMRDTAGRGVVAVHCCMATVSSAIANELLADYQYILGSGMDRSDTCLCLIYIYYCGC